MAAARSCCTASRESASPGFLPWRLRLRANAPLLVLAEDAQWLDRPTAEVLEFVARRLQSDPIVLVAAVREGYPSRLVDAGLPQHRLGGLAPAEAMTLLDESARPLSPVIRDRLLSEAAGNPLALIELPITAARQEPITLATWSCRYCARWSTSSPIRSCGLAPPGLKSSSRQRRIAESRAPLRDARDAFDAMGCAAWGDQARRELRASGESSRRRDLAASDQLTAQELQIAQLAQGLSNRDIAQRLYLSHRTIGTHLYRIFPKLGITSRGELRSALSARTALGERLT